MGVKGLWQVLEAEGVLDDCEVDFLALKGKILVVDVSIWLYQFVKSIPSNKDVALSPLVIGGLFQRVCKLLHFGIKPIFVFDGAAPLLKKDTIAARQELRRKGDIDYTKLAKKILKNKLKLMALEEVTGSDDSRDSMNKTNASKISEVKAPPIDFLAMLESTDGSEDEAQLDEDIDNYEIDTSSLEFKKLPYDIQEQILLESRKRTIDSSQIADISIESQSPESPKKGDNALDFSKAQVEALIKRRKLMDELESLRGNNVSKNVNDSKVISHGKIASSSEKKYIFAKNAQAGWTLSLTDANDEDSNDVKDVTTFAKPEKGKAPTISDIDDDDEFMEMMFGDVKEETISIENRPAQVSCAQRETAIPIEISESKPSSDDSDSEIDLNIPLRNIPTPAQPNVVENGPIILADLAEDILEPSPKLIQDDTIELPKIILEGLIKSQSVEYEETDNVERLAEVLSSSESELDTEYKDFIEEVSNKNIKENSTEFKELVDKLQNEVREFNALSEASALTSVSPTKVLIDAFMEMLHHFNLPFVIAPFEAEAQCVAISGTDGVISDDSDCLLFGAEAVYKGFFGGGSEKKARKGVVRITFEKITEKSGLTRSDFIVLAHLLGCDYCTGIDGIGPKRALELVRQVKCQDTLEALQKIKELAVTSESKYQKWLKGKIPNNFIDPRVSQAFLNPIVTPLKVEDLKWGKYDRGNLERFMAINAKWSKEKTSKFLLDIEKRNK